MNLTSRNALMSCGFSSLLQRSSRSKSSIYLGLIFAMGLAATMEMAGGSRVLADEKEFSLHGQTGNYREADYSVISESRWQEIDRSVDRGILWLVNNQHADGTYPGPILERTAITSLAAMAMISRGHVPGIGPEGEAINRSIDFICETQKSSGLLCSQPEDFSGQTMNTLGISYAHGISGLFLGEVYGMTSGERSERVKTAIQRALDFMRTQQQRPIPENREASDRGGWRYLPERKDYRAFSDLSITSWMIMFMRSAENAGFNVPRDWAQQAISYVQRCYDEKSGGFHYVLRDPVRITRGMTGAGVVCLFLTGNEQPEMEKAAGAYLRRYPFDAFNEGMAKTDRYIYAAYYCSQAAMQLGGETWSEIYPSIVDAFLASQQPDGSWPLEKKEARTGPGYSTSMAILALTPPQQLLPIYQR